jgi:hypothetical protein
MPKNTFSSVLNAAIEDVLRFGFDSKVRLDQWLTRLAAVIPEALASEATLSKDLKSSLRRVFARAMSKANLTKKHAGVGAFTIAQVKPKLRAELDRRILASADLIKLNRHSAILSTLQRLAGWISSVPPGGSDVQTRADVKKQVRRGIAGLPFQERRVIIDQGLKLNAAINDIIAVDGGAIAAIWRHVKRSDAAYDARPEHVARDGDVFLLRGSWADLKGLVKGAYTDSIEQPAELVYCSCWYEFIYSLDEVPTEMLTAKGKQAYLEARRLTA